VDSENHDPEELEAFKYLIGVREEANLIKVKEKHARKKRKIEKANNRK
jgi:hypothetical protein